jgi:hypothetical protein
MKASKNVARRGHPARLRAVRRSDRLLRAEEGAERRDLDECRRRHDANLEDGEPAEPLVDGIGRGAESDFAVVDEGLLLEDRLDLVVELADGRLELIQVLALRNLFLVKRGLADVELEVDALRREEREGGGGG